MGSGDDYLLGCDAVQSGGYLLTFLRNVISTVTPLEPPILMGYIYIYNIILYRVKVKLSL
jgi:hypothetical protein